MFCADLFVVGLALVMNTQQQQRIKHNDSTWNEEPKAHLCSVNPTKIRKASDGKPKFSMPPLPHAHTHARAHAHTHTRTHTRTHTYTHAHTRTHTKIKPVNSHTVANADKKWRGVRVRVRG